ncbi:TetR/AcrR family transcriptional regulator C-terminal domain-containing protein [Micromonospora sonneratiae]|uniref:TetR/AcrR family transcriptional regulator n=1 Tax=Micromonospora sonneratiae TaxID=1184706 RepID=A0ABW3YI75_9ACTN
MPRPRSLSTAQLGAAALAVIDRDGLAALTMRTVAAELGMSTMALYRYVADREELTGLVVEQVLGAVDTTAPAADLPWPEQVRIMVERIRVAVAAHPAVVPLTPLHRHRSVSILRWTETVLGILTGAGIDGPRRVVALRALLSYVNGAVQLEHLGPLTGAGTVVMSELPRADFPLLAETAQHARRIGPEEEFSAGLDILLRGLTGPAG